MASLEGLAGCMVVSIQIASPNKIRVPLSQQKSGGFCDEEINHFDRFDSTSSDEEFDEINKIDN